MSDFEKMNDALEAVSTVEDPKNKGEAVSKFWGRAILNNSLHTEEVREAVVDGIPGFVEMFGRELHGALEQRPGLLEGTWGKSVLVVNSQPSLPLEATARENGIPAEAFPVKSSVYEDRSGVVFGHVGIDGPIEQIWPPVPTQQVTGEIG